MKLQDMALKTILRWSAVGMVNLLILVGGLSTGVVNWLNRSADDALTRADRAMRTRDLLVKVYEFNRNQASAMVTLDANATNLVAEAKKLEETIQAFAALTETAEEKSAAKEMEQARQRLVEIHQREVLPLIRLILDTKEAGELAKLQAEAREAGGRTDEVWKTLIGYATRCSGSLSKKAELARNEHAGRLTKASTLVLGASVGASLIGGLLGFWLARNTSRSIQLVANALSASAEQTAAAAAQVYSASQSLATGVGEQSAALEQTSASLEEMSGVTKNNADSAQSATNLAKEARTAADTGARRS